MVLALETYKIVGGKFELQSGFGNIYKIVGGKFELQSGMLEGKIKLRLG